MKNNVVIGILGPTLDKGFAEKRWKRWRPTVSACWQEKFHVHNYELIYSEQFEDLKRVVITDIQSISPDTTISEHAVNFKDPWNFEEVFAVFHTFAKSYKFDTDKNNYYINITTGTHVAQICLFLLTESKYMPGKLFQVSANAKPDVKGSYRIIDLDLSKYNPIAARFEQERVGSQDFLKKGIQTKNKKFNHIISKIEKICLLSKEPILISGETGTGKTALARRIYELKKSKNKISGKLIEVNCATLMGANAMSTLFGHKKGAFTGAVSQREGFLKEADRGLLFLDEIGELGLDEQAMLLKAIEDKEFYPLGSDKLVKSEFELIAGTNRDLQEQVRKGQFRGDLLSRINLWTFKLPKLNERLEDIEANVEFELGKYSRKYGKKIIFTLKAKSEYLNFSKSSSSQWSGNFRDLNSSIIRMSSLSNNGKITLDVVEEEIELLRTQWSSTKDFDNLNIFIADETLDTLDTFEKIQLNGVISICKTSKSIADAGKKLFEKSRQRRTTKNDSDRLKKYLDKFNINATDLF